MLKNRNEEETEQRRNRAALGSQQVSAKLCYPLTVLDAKTAKG